MKKLLILLLSVMLLGCLAACEDPAPTEPQHEHSYTAEITKAATCSEEGEKTYTCACGEHYTTPVAKLEHTYTDEVTKDPTCSESGIQTYTCRCGDSYTESIKKSAHTYLSEITAPTCTKSGFTTFTCACGHSYQDDIVPATGHKYTHDVTAATCTEKGYTTYTCTCGDTYQDDVVAATGHSHTGEVTTQPTCTTEGVKTFTCHCGNTYTELVAKIAHTYTSAITAQPTCTLEGVKTFTCHCGNTYTEAIKMIAHTYLSETTAPTCSKSGYTTYTCHCGDTYTEPIATIAHTYTSAVTTDPTCTIEGIKTFTCHCGNTYTEPVAKIAHTYTSVVTAPTCIEKGYTTYTCVCGDTYTANEVPTGNHSYSSGTCTVCGVKDPNYIAEFSSGEKWIVDGQWELSFKDAVVTVVENGKPTVEVTWTYKNLGYTRNNGELSIDSDDFAIYDSVSYLASDTFLNVNYTHIFGDGQPCVLGAVVTCRYGWILSVESETIQIHVSVRDSNQKLRTAIFNVKVIPKAEEPEEDKLNGCTINLGTSLPQTISYYTYSGSKQSSCSVTDITFEVSGDDLYIYFSGKKTYDSRGNGQSDSCKIGWKLYDSNNNVIASGTAYTLSLAVGEGFLKTKDTAYNCITPGETYKLVILNVN